MNDRPKMIDEVSADQIDGEQHDDAVIGRAVVWSLVFLFVLGAAGGVIAYIATRPPKIKVTQTGPAVLPQTRKKVQKELPKVTFKDITQEAGINFVHVTGAYGAKLLPETMGSGCAFWDFDGDGDQDILLVNSTAWEFDERGPQAPAYMALYANDGQGHFEDVTEAAGLKVPIYGMGVATGDYDDDGRCDLFISAVGKNHLFHNVGGKFVDVTDSAGVGGDPDTWSTGCGWFDYNNDGLLDLFVANYIHWSREIDQSQDFRLIGVGRAYGPPTSFEGAFSYLYRNEGDGRFKDVSEETGIRIKNSLTGVPVGKSLGVVFVDYNDDGWLDIAVANDTVQNFLFHNQRDGKLAEIALQAGMAFDQDGRARGAMGIDAANFRNNDVIGIAIGNFSNEMNALYVKDNKADLFFDSAVSTGFGPPTRLQLTFGLFFFDYDLDGRLDIFEANGHLEQEINKVLASQHYEQPPQLFWNAGHGSGSEFVLVPKELTGEDFARPMVGRGAAFADIDNDGDLDILITASGGPPRLLRNEQTLNHHWLRVKLKAASMNLDAIGSEVELVQGSVTQRSTVMPTRSYLSQSEAVLTFGLGDHPQVDRLTIRWPDRRKQVIEKPAVDQLLIIQQEPSE